MKKIFLLSALSVATFGIMNAQTAATPQTTITQKQLPQVRAKMMVQKISNACGLQGEQIGKVNNLYIDYFTKLDAAKNAAEETQLTKNTDVALAGILSPSQAMLWKEASSK